MSARTGPRTRREGWPWPDASGAAQAPVDEVADAVARADIQLATAVLGVTQSTEQLRLALLRLEEAKREAELAAECQALREAGRVIARARQFSA